jgi:hypothetical protein
MARMLVAFAVAAGTVLVTGVVGISPALSADSWGCSYEKCLPACAKAGGTRCGAYCSKTLNDKRVAGTCK